METRGTRDERVEEGFDERYEMPGLGRWVKRNVWLLVRLSMVIIFTLGTSLVADQFSYGLRGAPKEISISQIQSGNLPPGVQLGDYVRVRGTAEIGQNASRDNVGTAESEIGVSARYEVAYYYFRLQEGGDDLLIQSGNDLPTFNGQPREWSGKLSNVGTVIFHNTTQAGLERAGLPHAENIPVVEVGETPGAYRDLFPAYSVVVGIWVLSLAWLLWKRNQPFA